MNDVEKLIVKLRVKAGDSWLYISNEYVQFENNASDTSYNLDFSEKL